MRPTTVLVAPAGALAAVLVLASAPMTDADDVDTPVAADAQTDGSAPGGADQQPQLPPQIAAKMAGGPPAEPRDEFPKFNEVVDGYEKVVSTADEAASLYTLWTRKKDGQMLAELPRNFAAQKLFIAYTISGGTMTAGVQTGDAYGSWRRFDRRLALIEPNYGTRTTGDLESTKGRDRVFTDRVILDVPILTMGPGGGPVIDMDGFLLGQSGRFFGLAAMGANQALATIEKAKAFPENVEIAYAMPMADGRFATLHYSISVLPENTGYKTREADARIGYFTTTYRDIGHPGRDTPWVRYVNRWKLEKADPKLGMSPPKEPIVFYLEHTIPVRYRRWVRDGVLEWNKAFEKIGFVNAIEVHQQDAGTGAHMEKDPEDARFDFVLWTNAGMGFAIGPSRVDPRTGQIIDADIVMDEGFITSWVDAWKRVIPEVAMRNFDPTTLAWLQTRAEWDPRVLLAAPAERPRVVQEIARLGAAYGGHPAADADPRLLGDDAFDGLAGRVSQVSGRCDYAMSAGFEMALLRLDPDLITELARGSGDVGGAGNGESADEPKEEGKETDLEQKLDGIPERFVGPLLKGVVTHEVGHTLGLRHNFKASSAFSLAEINSEERRGQPTVGSVMEYTPININMGDGEVQGEYAMATLGPYDYWAIEYGYGSDDGLKGVLARVAEPQLAFATDEDSWGSDPLTRTFDLGSDPIAYAESQMRLVAHLRGEILDRMVKDGDSWAKAREGYELVLGRQLGAVGIAARWIGGAHVNRDRKGDKNGRDPIVPASVEQQRRALAFVLTNTFRDEAFGLTPELLAKMTIDKWWDDGGFSSIFEDAAWPVHDRVMTIQSIVLSMLMNPTTLSRVHDNELRVPAAQDALTLPEMIGGISDEIWSELDQTSTKKLTNREPMISSLRRNVQREHLERLVDLMLPNPALGVAAKPVATLATQELRDLNDRIGKALERKGTRIDDYTVAHLSEAKARIGKALDAQYIYNADDLGASAWAPSIFGKAGARDE